MTFSSTFLGVPITDLDADEVQLAILNGNISSKLAQQVEDYWAEEERQMTSMGIKPFNDIKANITTTTSSGEATTDDPSKIGTGAVKYDLGKSPVFQGFINYFPRAIRAVADVSGFGAQKYAWDGWADVENGFNRYKDAQFRHILDFATGEAKAKDSDLYHLAHEAWGAMATLELYLQSKEQ